jgi:hypothetical protein
MVRGYYAQLVSALRDGGYEFKRNGKGDHEIWQFAIAAPRERHPEAGRPREALPTATLVDTCT